MDELHEALGTMTERLGGAEGAEQNPDDGLPDKQATSFIVKKAIAYIEQNYAKKLSLQEVADYCYVSQWHLSKLINKYAEKAIMICSILSASKRPRNCWQTRALKSATSLISSAIPTAAIFPVPSKADRSQRQ